MKQTYTAAEAQELFKKAKHGWNPDKGLRKPARNKQTVLKETPGLECVELGKGKPYLGREEDMQTATANFLAIYDLFKCAAFHVPNGGKREKRVNEHGKEYSLEGKRLKAQGVKEGVSDWIILEPFNREGVYYPGLIVELKNKSGVVSPAQIEFLNSRQAKGYKVAVCWNAESFEDLIRWAYLK